MHVPPFFAETRLPVLHELMRAHPFATIVGATTEGLDAQHAPLLLDAARGACGVLLGHLARANPVWTRVSDGSEVLVVFHGPDHYVSPGWYPSKRRDPEVVPTWNYAVVHARGQISWRHDRVWLRNFLERLTDEHERTREPPWQLTDAPAAFIERMLKGIVGFEIAIAQLEGKWKLSQNRNAADRAGVASALAREPGAAAAAMTELLRERLAGTGSQPE